jgi:hypothetical protein
LGAESQRHDAGRVESPARHRAGDRGDVDADDRRANDRAVRDGDRVLSAFETAAGRVSLTSEWDRSVTTVLLPEEYEDACGAGSVRPPAAPSRRSNDRGAGNWPRRPGPVPARRGHRRDRPGL